PCSRSKIVERAVSAQAPAFEQALNIFADNIGFDVDFSTNPEPKQISAPQRVGDDRDRKTLLFALVYGQADAIHGDRAFGDQKGMDRRRDLKGKEGELASLLDLPRDCYAVHVTGH